MATLLWLDEHSQLIDIERQRALLTDVVDVLWVSSVESHYVSDDDILMSDSSDDTRLHVYQIAREIGARKVRLISDASAWDVLELMVAGNYKRALRTLAIADEQQRLCAKLRSLMPLNGFQELASSTSLHAHNEPSIQRMMGSIIQ